MAFVDLGDVDRSVGVAFDVRGVICLGAAREDDDLLLPVQGLDVQGFLVHVPPDPASSLKEGAQAEAVGVEDVHLGGSDADAGCEMDAVRMPVQGQRPGQNVDDVLAGTLAPFRYAEPGILGTLNIFDLLYVQRGIFHLSAPFRLQGDLTWVIPDSSFLCGSIQRK